MKGLLSIAIIFTLFTFSSCRNSDRDRDTSTQASAEFWIASNHFNTLMREIHKVAQVDSVLNNVPVADALKPDICNDSIMRTPDMGSYPIDLSIFYSDKNTCDGERNRSGKIIAVVTEGDVTVKEIADHVIEIPETEEAFTPLLTTIPLQLLSYHIAVMRNCNVDQPRNLAKSVTVE